MAGQEFGADHKPSIGQRFQGDVLEDLPSWQCPGGFCDGFENILRTVVHLRLELLVHHHVAQPAGDPGAGQAVGLVRQIRSRQQEAEVGGDLRKPLSPAVVSDGGHANCIAQITGDDLGLGFVDEEPGAVEKLHHPGGARQASLGEQDQPAALG